MPGEHNNQYVNIYVDRKDQCASELRPEVLSCETFNTFWIEWSGRALKVGVGHVPGTGLITECPDVDLEVISGVSVASAMAQEGYWQFEDVTSGRPLTACHAFRSL